MIILGKDNIELRSFTVDDQIRLAELCNNIHIWNNVRDYFPHPYTEKDAGEFISMCGKGCVWINGHHLGRYWEIGPQQTLYVPSEWLKNGQNEVVVLELLKSGQTVMQGLNSPVLDQLQ